MAHQLSRIRSLTLAVLVLGGACADDLEDQSDTGVQTSTDGSTDVGFDIGRVDDGGLDRGEDSDSEFDMSEGGAWYEDPGLVRPRSFYECGAKQQPLEYGRPTTPYLPAPSDQSSDGVSYAELERTRATLRNNQTVTIFEPGDGTRFLSALSVLNLDRGEDLSFRFGFVFPGDGNAANQWITTLLIDYEPIEATFRFRDDDGTTLGPTQTGTGFALPWGGYSGIVDVEIPGEVFQEAGYHEFLFRSAVRRPGHYPYQLGQRTTVWVDSNQRSHHGCFEHAPAVGPLPSDLVPPANLAKLGFDRHMFLLPLNLISYDKIDREITVLPGQTVEFEYYVLGMTGLRSPLRWGGPEILIPAVNGEPVVDPEYVLLEEPREEDPEDVMYRGSFEYQVPEEPGTYDIEVIQVIEAFIPFMNWAGDFNLYPYDYPVRRGGVHQGTQIIRLRVLE